MCTHPLGAPTQQLNRFFELGTTDPATNKLGLIFRTNGRETMHINGNARHRSRETSEFNGSVDWME